MLHSFIMGTFSALSCYKEKELIYFREIGRYLLLYPHIFNKFYVLLYSVAHNKQASGKSVAKSFIS